MNHDNPMTIGFVGDEMTLKTTLFVYISIVISKALISCVIGLEERLQPWWPPRLLVWISSWESSYVITLTPCQWNTQMHLNQVMIQSPSSWIYHIWSWLAIRNKVLGLKVNWGHFENMMHLNIVSWSLLKLEIFVSQVFKRWHVSGSGSSCMQYLFLRVVDNDVTWLSRIHA